MPKISDNNHKYNTRVNSPVSKGDSGYQSINQIPVSDINTRQGEYPNKSWQPVNNDRKGDLPVGDNLPPPRTGARVRDDYVTVPTLPKLVPPPVKETESTLTPPIPVLEIHCGSSVYR